MIVRSVLKSKPNFLKKINLLSIDNLMGHISFKIVISTVNILL